MPAYEIELLWSTHQRAPFGKKGKECRELVGVDVNMRVADMHCDTISKIYYERKEGKEISLRHNDFCVDLEKMKKADYILQFFACFVETGVSADLLEDALGMINTFHKEMDNNKDLISVINSYEDIERNLKDGKMSALLTIEEGGAVRGSIDILDDMYRLGVRLMTLTWNFENELGYPNQVPEIGNGSPQEILGLKDRGIEMIKEMERLHMIVDVSHLGDAGFYDVYRNTQRPFMASHSNARRKAGHVRNLTDDMIKKIAERGGIIGLNFCPAFLREGFTSEAESYSYVKDMVRHLKYIRNIGGIEVLSLGSDFDGIGGNLEISDCSLMWKLGEALMDKGFTQDETEKIFSGNVLRFLKDTL